MGDVEDALEATARKPSSLNADPELSKALTSLGIDPDEVGRIRQVWVKTRTDDNGDHVAAGYSMLLSPKWETGPEWPLVEPARPVSVRVPKAREATATDGWRTLVVHPDPQVGYRRLHDGTLDPTHDPAAIDAAVALTEKIRPDHVALLGDTLDLPQMGRFRVDPSFVGMIQPALDYTHAYLARVAGIAPVDLFQGNHDLRLQHYIVDNAAAAFGIRPANAPDSWPVLSVRTLLRLDELGVTYHDGYPANHHYYGPLLQARHGTGAGDARKVLADTNVTVVMGHGHRHQRLAKVIEVYTPSGVVRREVEAYSPGCLCRVDGPVPGTMTGVDERGSPRRQVVNWQQGVGVIHFHDELDPIIEHAPVRAGRVWWRGRWIN